MSSVSDSRTIYNLLTNLRFDVPPFARCLHLHQEIVESFPHGNDTVCHLLDFAEPRMVSAGSRRRR